MGIPQIQRPDCQVVDGAIGALVLMAMTGDGHSVSGSARASSNICLFTVSNC